jgi:hypothetical protein
MTVDGDVKAIGRHGISGKKSSVLARAAFEITAQHLLNAGISGEFDGLTGVAENIIVGQPVTLGTGAVNLVFQPEQMVVPPEVLEKARLAEEKRRLEAEERARARAAAEEAEESLEDWTAEAEEDDEELPSIPSPAERIRAIIEEDDGGGEAAVLSGTGKTRKVGEEDEEDEEDEEGEEGEDGEGDGEEFEEEDE